MMTCIDPSFRTGRIKALYVLNGLPPYLPLARRTVGATERPACGRRAIPLSNATHHNTGSGATQIRKWAASIPGRRETGGEPFTVRSPSVDRRLVTAGSPAHLYVVNK